MVIWSTTEIVVFFLVGLMILFKLWSVWHVANRSQANRTGRLIFLGLIATLTLFGAGAKAFISYQMGI